MSERFPPLTALRAFEAAARHMSFANAADELNVTPAALSFQIKSLEEHLGAPVFRRLNRAVELTELGRLLQPGIEEGFSRLTSAWSAARRELDQSTLTVTAGPAFTAKWLAPRLFRFAQQHPDIELRFSASLKLVDFQRDNVDVAIRFGQSPDTGLFSSHLLDDWLVPMAAPELVANIREGAALGAQTLLHQDDIAFLKPEAGWGPYFALLGEGPAPSGGPRFSHADHAIDAALAGAGVVLGRITMADAHLREGRLEFASRKAMLLNAGYRIVCPHGSETRPQIQRFMDWVQAEVEGVAEWRGQVEFLNAPDV